MTVRNTTVRCGHLSLSRVASRNKTFLSLHGNGKGLQEEERYEKKESEREGERRSVQRSLTRWDAADALASTPSSFVVSESVPPALFPPCSPNAFPPPFFISLYGLIPSFPRRARYIYRLVSPSGSCLYHTATSPGLACRSPSKTVSPPRFMFPPTQRRIDPFLLSDVYV